MANKGYWISVKQCGRYFHKYYLILNLINICSKKLSCYDPHHFREEKTKFQWLSTLPKVTPFGSLRHKFRFSRSREDLVKVKFLSCVWLFAAPWTIVYQACLSMGFSRQGYWSGLPFPSPGDLPNPGIEPRSPTLQADALPSEPPGRTEN